MKKNKNFLQYKLKTSRNCKGFTLIEVLVTIFVFSLLMTMLSGSFANLVKVYAQEKKSQKALENAQYVLNLMEKTIRTSTVTTNGSQSVNPPTVTAANPTGIMAPALDFSGSDNNMIKLFDNSRGKCLVYKWDNVNNNLQVATDFSLDATSISSCDFSETNVSAHLTNLTQTNNISKVSVYGWASVSGAAGRVSVAFTVKEPGQASPIYIGMTASLRDSKVEQTSPAPQTCTSWTYSAWGACQADSTQSRTIISSSPSGCSGGTPAALTQSCVYVATPATCTSWTYSAWGACQANGTQTRTIASSLPNGCAGGTPAPLSQSCTYVAPGSCLSSAAPCSDQNSSVAKAPGTTCRLDWTHTSPNSSGWNEWKCQAGSWVYVDADGGSGGGGYESSIWTYF